MVQKGHKLPLTQGDSVSWISTYNLKVYASTRILQEHDVGYLLEKLCQTGEEILLCRC